MSPFSHPPPPPPSFSRLEVFKLGAEELPKQLFGRRRRRRRSMIYRRIKERNGPPLPLFFGKLVARLFSKRRRLIRHVIYCLFFKSDRTPFFPPFSQFHFLFLLLYR